MKRFKAVLVLVAAMASVPATSAMAAQPDSGPQGIYLTTPFPALTLQAGETSTIDFTLTNRGTAPERLNLSVDGVPKGWTATLMGNGQPVLAAMPQINDQTQLKLRLDIPKTADTSLHTLTIQVNGDHVHQALPVQVALADHLPPKLSLQSELPQLTGTVDTAFEYQLTLKNDSGQDTLVSLAADTPEYFDAYFTESYGSQKINALPLKAGESKRIKLSVHPPRLATTGQHAIKVTATAEGVSTTTDLIMQLTGQPKLSLSGRDGRMSASAQIKETTSIPLEIHNTGTTTATDIQLGGQAPSGWKMTFEPERIGEVKPGQTVNAQAMLTPSGKALSGDYQVSIQARSKGHSAEGQFRVTVTTSTLWGVTGVILIAIALLVLIGAITKFGRR